MNTILMASILMGSTVYDQSKAWSQADELSETVVMSRGGFALTLEEDNRLVDQVSVTPNNFWDVSGLLIQHDLLTYEYQDITYRRDITGHYSFGEAGEAWCPLTNRFEEFELTMDVTGTLEVALDNATRQFKPLRPGDNYLTMTEGTQPRITSNTVTVNWTLEGPISSVSGTFDWAPLNLQANLYSAQGPISDVPWTEHAAIHFFKFPEPFWVGTLDGVDFTLKKQSDFIALIVPTPVPEPSAAVLALMGFALITGRRRR